MSQPATITEIKAACPGIDSDFAIGLLERNLTLTQCQQEFIAEQGRRLSEQNRKLAATSNVDRPGVRTSVAAGGGGNDPEITGDAEGEFGQAVRTMMERYNIDRQQAVVRVSKTNPDLHRRYLLETNMRLGRPNRSIIEDKFVQR